MKKTYKTPRTKMIELQAEGIIANSSGPMRAKTINRTATDEWGDVAETRSKLWGED